MKLFIACVLGFLLIVGLAHVLVDALASTPPAPTTQLAQVQCVTRLASNPMGRCRGSPRPQATPRSKGETQ
jgi:hypothetical protein